MNKKECLLSVGLETEKISDMVELNRLIKESGRTKKWIAKKLNMPYVTLNFYLWERVRMPKEVEQKIKDLL